MKVVCAWCSRHLAGHPDDPTTSHSICGLCLQSQLVLADLPSDPWSLWQDEGGGG
jgi:hypothetical protein